MRLDPLLAARISLLEGVESWDDPRVEAFSLPVQEWRRPAVQVEDVLTSDRLGVPIRLYRPMAVEPRRGLLWLHGGGFAGGSIDMPESDYVASELAARASVLVASVDYRLVDEHVRYPLPVEDVLHAWKWLTARAPSFGVDGPVALGGASAGGCLSVSVALRLRDEGGPLPSALLLAYPALHAVMPSLASEEEAELAVLPALFRFEAGEVYEMFERYLGRDPAVVDDPYAIPGIADPRGLPPTLVVTSEYDRLRASGEAFADSLRAAGVVVECFCERGTLHGHLNTIGLAAGEASLERFAAFLRDY